MTRLRATVFVAAVTAIAWPQLVLASPPAGGAHDATQVPHAEAAHDGGIEWITPVFGNTGKLGLLWILINFAVLVWLLERLLFSKLRASTRKKHDEASTELQRATDARQKAETALAEYESRLSGLESEIATLLKEAAARAETDRKRIVEAAVQEAEQIKASARATAEREGEAHLRRLETEVVDRAVARAEVLIREQIGVADQHKMVDEFIGRLGSLDFTGAPGHGAGGAGKGSATS